MGKKEKSNVVPLPQAVVLKEDYTCHLKFIGLPENDKKFPNEKSLQKNVDVVLHKLGGQIEIDKCRRSRRFDENGARLLLFTFKSVWDVKLCVCLAFQNKSKKTEKIPIVP